MSEVKFPVCVRVNGKESYEWLTLAQANERFFVVKGIDAPYCFVLSRTRVSSVYKLFTCTNYLLN